MRHSQPDVGLKYRIKVLLLQRYPEDSARAEVIRQISNRLNVSPNHFRKMTNYQKGSPNEVKLSQLKIIADYFGTTPMALVTSYE